MVRAHTSVVLSANVERTPPKPPPLAELQRSPTGLRFFLRLPRKVAIISVIELLQHSNYAQFFTMI
jgi:hypothetical protein